MTHLYIATPMYGGQCSGYFAHSLLALVQLLGTRGVRSSYRFLFNESLIPRGRNALVHGFLATDATHLLFIDSDIRFRAEDAVAMLAADVDILCGLYPKKEVNWLAVSQAAARGVPAQELSRHSGSFVVNLASKAASQSVPENLPVEIANGGTGFMLIKRAVFEKLAPFVPEYANDLNDLSGALAAGASVKEFFATSIEPETRRLLSEDYHFCKLWRQHGGKVHAAPWAKLSHVGNYVFEGELTRG